MRQTLSIALALLLALAGTAQAASFIYSCKETQSDPKTWRIYVGRVENGEVSTKELFATDEVRLFYSFIGSAGSRVVVSRQGEGIAEAIDTITSQRRVIDSEFARAVCISEDRFVYLAEDTGAQSPQPTMLLKRHIFSDAESETICFEKVLERIPFPAADNPHKTTNVFWGVFLVDGRRVIGKVDLNTGTFSRAAELAAADRLLSADVSEDGRYVVLGLADSESLAPTTGMQAMATQLRLVDTLNGESRVLLRSIYQAVPEASGMTPRFTALFAGSDCVLYPETVLRAIGGISFQRLMELHISTGKKDSVAVIEDAERLINAVPVRALDGIIEWAEYQVDPVTRKSEPLDRFRGKPFTLTADGDLLVGGKRIGHVERAVHVWSSKGVAAFVGTLEDGDSPRLYVFSEAMEKPARVNPEPCVVQTFGFLDTP